MANGKLRVGIVGASMHRGTSHPTWAISAHIPALRSLPNYEITALSTTRRESAEAAAAHFNVPYAFTTAEELANHPEVDIVAVSVRVPYHVAVATAALNAGKHVFCEWPLAATSAEAIALRDHAAETGVTTIVGLQARMAPAFQELRDRIANGYIGRPLSAQMSLVGAGWGEAIQGPMAYLDDQRNGATMLSIPGAHAMDPLCLALGEFTEVSATIASQFHEARVVETGATIPKTAADQVVVSGVMESGAVVSIHLQGGMRHLNHFALTIRGTEGVLEVSSPGSAQITGPALKGLRGRESDLEELRIGEQYTLAAAELMSGPAFNVAQLYVELGRAIAEGRPASPDFALAVRRHLLLDAIEAAAQTGVRARPRGA